MNLEGHGTRLIRFGGKLTRKGKEVGLVCVVFTNTMEMRKRKLVE
jgi:hypothetical protein